MSNVRVRLKKLVGNFAAEADILDTPGPINRWKSRTSGAWGVEEGDFTNLLGKGDATGGQAMYAWTLEKFDIDTVKVGDMGTGVTRDGRGSLPPGDLKWEVFMVF